MLSTIWLSLHQLDANSLEHANVYLSSVELVMTYNNDKAQINKFGMSSLRFGVKQFTMTSLIRISEVNKLDKEQFEWMFGNVVELCTDAAAKVQKKRPFKNVEDLCNAFHEYLENLSIEGECCKKMFVY